MLHSGLPELAISAVLQSKSIGKYYKTPSDITVHCQRYKQGTGDEAAASFTGGRNGIHRKKPSGAAADAMTCLNSLEHLTSPTRITLCIFNAAIALLATLGNLSACYVFLSNRSLLTRSNCYLISMAVTDLLVGMLLEPLFIAQLASAELAKNCALNGARRFVTAALSGATMGTIALISFDRFVHLSKTLLYNNYMSKGKVAILIAMTWVLPIVSTFFKYIGSKEIVYSASIFVYALAMVVITITSYVKIFKIVRQKRMRISRNSQDNAVLPQKDQHDQRFLSTDIKVLKMVSIVIACFFVFVFPISVFHGLAASSKLQRNSKVRGDQDQLDNPMVLFYSAAMTISMANSVINPVIYYFRMPDFRRAAKRSLDSTSVNARH